MPQFGVSRLMSSLETALATLQSFGRRVRHTQLTHAYLMCIRTLLCAMQYRIEKGIDDDKVIRAAGSHYLVVVLQHHFS